MLLLILFLMLLPSQAFALSCVEIPTKEAAYEKYDGIIIGKVKEVVRKKEHNEVKLEVVKSYKAIDQTLLSVNENITWGALSGPSEVGEQYLFFLKKEGTEWENPLCAPSNKVSESANELDFLKDKEIPLPSPSKESIGPSGNASEQAEPLIGKVGKEASSGVPLTIAIPIVLIILVLLTLVLMKRKKK